MITEEEVPDILIKELPEIKIELKKQNENIFKVFHCFTNYTKKCVETGNINKLKSCFLIADKFLRKGNKAVKSDVENVYINDFSPLFEVVPSILQKVEKILPENLKKACLKHIADLNSLSDWKDENCLYQFDKAELKNKYYIPVDLQ